MLRGGRGVTIRIALLLAVVACGFSYLVLRLWTGQGRALPPSSWAGLTVLAFMASGVFFAGLPVRRFLRGQATRPLNPLRAMRTLVLAQACALTGAVVTGWYTAQVLLLLPDLDVSSRRTLAVMLAALAAGGVLMVIAGLAVQAMCRLARGDSGSDGQQHGDRDRDDGEEPESSRER